MMAEGGLYMPTFLVPKDLPGLETAVGRSRSAPLGGRPEACNWGAPSCPPSFPTPHPRPPTPALLRIALGPQGSNRGILRLPPFGFESRVRLGYTEAVRKMNCPRPPGPSALPAAWDQEKPEVTAPQPES